jgi:hypothetical protein
VGSTPRLSFVHSFLSLVLFVLSAESIPVSYLGAVRASIRRSTNPIKNFQSHLVMRVVSFMLRQLHRLTPIRHVACGLDAVAKPERLNTHLI